MYKHHAVSFAPPPRAAGLNPNAAEFRPLLSTAGVPPAPAMPPKVSMEADDFSGEMHDLLGQDLCDELWRGGGLDVSPSSARTSVGTSRATQDIDDEALRKQRMVTIL